MNSQYFYLASKHNARLSCVANWRAFWKKSVPFFEVRLQLFVTHFYATSRNWTELTPDNESVQALALALALALAFSVNSLSANFMD